MWKLLSPSPLQAVRIPGKDEVLGLKNLVCKVIEKRQALDSNGPRIVGVKEAFDRGHSMSLLGH